MNKYQSSSHKVMSAQRVKITFVAIIILAILGCLVALPKPGFIPNNNWFRQFKIHLGLDLQGGTHLVYQADVSQVPDNERRDRVEALRDVIERRVNAYGVSEPVVQTNYSGDNYRIIVELAGVTDVNQAISIIDKTPLLEFKTQGQAPIDNNDQNAVRDKANDILQRVLKGEDFAELAKQYSEDPVSAAQGGDLPWVTKGKFVPEFDTAIFDQLKTGEVDKQLVESQFGYHIIKKIEERTNDSGEKEVHAAHILIKKIDADMVWEDTSLSGRNIKKAELSFDQNTQEPLVLINFDDQGKEIFADLTTANVGKPIAIFLDGVLRSEPVVQEAITDGSAQISGKFTIKEAKQLVKDLNLGALPVPIKLVTQQTVGPTLGQVSLDKSLIAGIIGFLAAALFMLILYRLPGILAVVALGLYTILSLSIFEIIPVTMTMAGIAGFILSIGMAVDANILIFERTKEELYKGKTLWTAIEEGFSRAWPSIRDSNVSSIITCIILAWFGTSIIRGFAITLGIGILVSMFSAITVTRTFLYLVVNKKLENKLSWFGVHITKTTEEQQNHV
ncbi:MAG: protein translocase subunit SecD [Patescibacteria group bacterium]